jgi:hypothetical protein
VPPDLTEVEGACGGVVPVLVDEWEIRPPGRAGVRLDALVDLAFLLFKMVFSLLVPLTLLVPDIVTDVRPPVEEPLVVLE